MAPPYTRLPQPEFLSPSCIVKVHGQPGCGIVSAASGFSGADGESGALASATVRLCQARMTKGAGNKDWGCCKRIIQLVDHELQGGKKRKEKDWVGEMMVGEKVAESLGGGVLEEACLGESELEG